MQPFFSKHSNRSLTVISSASVFAIIKTYYLSQLTARADITYMTFDVMCWAGAELLVIIVCGSIPTLKPLYDHYLKGKRFSKWYASFGSTFRSRGGSTMRSGYKDPAGSSSSPLNTLSSSRRKGQSELASMNSTHSEGRVPLAPLPNNIVITNNYEVESHGYKDRARYERV